MKEPRIEVACERKTKKNTKLWKGMALNYSIHDRTLNRQLHIFVWILSDFRLLELDVIKLEEKAGH